MLTKTQEYYRKDMEKYLRYYSKQNDPPLAENALKFTEKMFPETPVYIPPVTRPGAEESDVAWCCYYLTKLRYAFWPSAISTLLPEQDAVDKAVAHFAAEDDLTLLEAARLLYCHFAEGLRTSDTERFTELYYYVNVKTNSTLDKYNV